jgi:diguanylate cyclase (GGDEF)-like protein
VSPGRVSADRWILTRTRQGRATAPDGTDVPTSARVPTSSARLFLTAHQVALALLVCAVLTFLGAVRPPSAGTRVGFWYVSSAVLLVTAGAAWLLRDRRWAAVSALVVGVLVCGLLIAVCRTAAGVVTTGLGMVCAGQAAALLGGRTLLRRVLELVLVVLGIAMVVSPVEFRAMTWLVIAATTVVSSGIVGWLAARLRLVATTDDLTGALTRAAFEERVAELLDRSRRSGDPLALVCVDVDDFKGINDSRGHLAGDDVLVDLVDGWRAALEDGEAIGRIGGDEFAVVLTGTDAADRWITRVAGGVAGDRPSWSHGVAVAGPGDGVRDLLGRADAAMYASKGRREVAPGIG